MKPLELAQHVLTAHFRTELERFNGTMPPALYHYTSAAGMEGILNSACFWASDIQHQNDLAELRVAASIFRANVERFRVIEGEDEMVPLFDSIRRIMDKIRFDDVYVLSLVANGDDDNLWRLYGDRRRGFSLTFPTILPLTWNENWVLAKVQYGERAVQDFFERSLRLIRTIYRQDIGQGIAASAEDYAALIFDNIRWFAPVFKLETWSDEKEWRLFRIGSNGERCTRLDGRHYLKAPSKTKLRLAAVAAGPLCRPEMVVQVSKTAIINGYELPVHHSQHAIEEHRQAVDEAMRTAKPE